MKIRKAKLKDLPEIIELAVTLLKYHEKFDPYFTPAKGVRTAYSTFFTACIYSPRRLLLVAEQDHKIIGYSLGAITSRPPVFKIRKIGQINDMFIVEKFRNSGIANLFLKELFSWFRIKRVEHIEIGVHIKNEVGKSVWTKYGFEDFMIKQRKKIRKGRKI